METGTGRRRCSAIALAGLLLALPFGSVDAASVVPLPAEIDEAGVDLLDDAIDALGSGDTTAYDSFVQTAEVGEVWLPTPALFALQDRDFEDVLLWSLVLDTDHVDLLDNAAYGVIEDEQSAVALISNSMTDEQTQDVNDADLNGVGVLEVIDRRQIAIPDSMRIVLTSILSNNDGTVPSDRAYGQALEDLDLLLDQIESLGGAVPAVGSEIAPPTENPAPVPNDVPEADATPAVAEEPVAPEVTETETAAEAEAETATETETATPDTTPAASESSTGLSLAVILPMGVAGFALLIALFSVIKGRKTDDLADIAFTDSLTGLKNRRRLDSDLAAQRAAGQRQTATLMVDVDHFKSFNDEHGHAMGDEVLRLVGEALSNEFRKKDVPYRYGGEEFCVILADTTHDEALAAGERARRAIEQIELPIPGGITASVGVSTGPATGVADTIKRADGALYDAKNNGRNRVADDTDPSPG
ncbi:MAG: GGDEF domain-containing protein [Ilumatobacter sp.]